MTFTVHGLLGIFMEEWLS